MEMSKPQRSAARPATAAAQRPTAAQDAQRPATTAVQDAPRPATTTAHDAPRPATTTAHDAPRPATTAAHDAPRPATTAAPDAPRPATTAAPDAQGPTTNVSVTKFYVNKIVDQRTVNNRVEYLVSWKFLEERNNSWVPAWYLSCTADIKEFKRQRRGEITSQSPVEDEDEDDDEPVYLGYRKLGAADMTSANHTRPMKRKDTERPRNQSPTSSSTSSTPKKARQEESDGDSTDFDC